MTVQNEVYQETRVLQLSGVCRTRTMHRLCNEMWVQRANVKARTITACVCPCTCHANGEYAREVLETYKTRAQTY